MKTLKYIRASWGNQSWLMALLATAPKGKGICVYVVDDTEGFTID